MRRPLALLAGSLVLLTGCGVSVGNGSDDVPTLGTDDLEQEVATQLEAEVGTAPKAVTCDDPLPAEVDAQVRCVLTAPDDTRIGMTVTTTAVDGDNVRFGIRVDQEPMD